MVQRRARRLGVGFGIARLGAGVAAQVPDQLAVVLEVEHRQALDGPQDQDLVAPEVGAQQHVAHPGLDRGPGVAVPLAQHDLDPAPDHAAMPAQVAEDPPPLGRVVGREARELEQVGDGPLAAMDRVP